jgi:hypothetical protein
MSWDRTLLQYIDITRTGGEPCLLEGKFSSDRRAVPAFIEGDDFPLKLLFRQRATDGGASTPITLEAGSHIIYAGKARGGQDATVPLFATTSFTVDGTSDDLGYLGIVDLNTTELHTALYGKASIDVEIDVEVQNADNTQRISFRITATVKRESYKDGDLPTPVYPSFPRGTVDLAGVDSVDVDLTPFGLSAAPAQILLSIRKPTGGDTLFASVRDATLSAAGFTADLSAAPASEGYKLDYLVILA